MYDNDNPTQELSVAASSNHDDTEGCPVCGGPIQFVERRGPNDVSVSPCGHDITDAQATALATTEQRQYATDGGSVEDSEHPTDVTVLERQDGYVCIKTNPDSAMGRRTLLLKPEELANLRDELAADEEVTA